MKWRLLAALCAAVILCIFVSSCGGGSKAIGPPPITPNPVPAIQSFSPQSVAAGSNSFTLTVNGSGFLANSVVTWNGTAKTATLVGPAQLTIPVASADISNSGSVEVAVVNPSPGGGKGTSTFTVAAPPAPSVSSISPTTVMMGGPTFTVTVTGTGFVQGSTIEWNGSPRSTTYVSNTQLTATISAADISSPGAVPVSVSTPSPGGGNSTALPMTVTYPLPAVSSVSPANVIVGSGAFTLTVNGSNFVQGATVYWNSIARVTTYVSATQLTANILASDATSASIAAVTVQNPSPSAGISNVASFMVANPLPQVASITPTTGLAGTDLTLSIQGSGFIADSTVQLGTQALAVSAMTSTQITAQIAFAGVGNLALTVVNPAPGGGSSNPVTFNSTAAGPPTASVVASVDGSGNTTYSDHAAMSSTGRYVVFGSSVRDTCIGVPSGCTPATELFTSTTDSAFGVSDDGRYVVTQLGTSGNADMKFWDTCIGAAQGCTPSSMSPSGLEIVPSGGTWLAPNARYFGYSTGLAADTSLPAYLYDTCVGAPPGCNPTQISINGSTPGGFVSTTSNSISATPDGRYVVYEDENWEIVLHDSCLGAPPGCSPSDQILSAPGITCEHPSISSDAQYVSYSCRVPGMQVLLQNTCVGAGSGCTQTRTQLPDAGVNSNASLINGNGRYVAYVTTSAVISGQTLPNPTVYVYDSCVGAPSGCQPQAVPACLASDGAIANDSCSVDGISSDGKYLLISSPATNLVALPSGVSSTSYLVPNPLY